MDPQQVATAITIFAGEFAAKIMANLSFLEQSMDWSLYARGKKVVHPQATAIPGVIRNPSTANLVPTGNGHILAEFDIEAFQTVPTKIYRAEELLTNYALRNEILDAHLSSSNEDMAKTILYRWANGIPASNIVRTSGGARQATAPGALGNRKKVTIEDLIGLVTVLNNANMPNDGARCMVVDALQYGDMLAIKELWDSGMNKRDETLVSGAVTKIMGMNVFVRSGGSLVASNDATPVMHLYKENDTLDIRLPEGDDNSVIFAWHPKAVARAISRDSKVNIVPMHGGEELSITPLAGGGRFYNNFAGIAALVEAAA
jgi:hypothetical protein